MPDNSLDESYEIEFKKFEDDLTEKCINFLNNSRSSYAAIDTFVSLLKENGFSRIREKDSWNLLKGGKYFYTRGLTTIVAFTVGGKFEPQNGYTISAAHSDSPCLKLKPSSKITKHGFNQVGVQLYGGGLWHTWFDRDLGLSGLVIYRKDNSIEKKVINIAKPILRIPSLAIHLDGGVNTSFQFNSEINFVPIISSESQQNQDDTLDVKDHHRELLELIAKEVNCNINDICEFDLSLCDAQDSVIGGVKNEFIFSGRLDNLLMSWSCMNAFIEASKKDIEEETNTLMCVIFNDEEVGSLSTTGANSTVLEQAMKRISTFFNNNKPTDIDIPIRKSLLFSCDMAHAVHPNYPEKYEINHQPKLHGGPVLKVNANTRYATNAVTSLIVKDLAKINNIPIQHFVIRNDSSSGSTIGPILSGRLGMRCVDLGISQLAMHSIREIAGTKDLVHASLLLISFYKNFSKISHLYEID